MTFVRGLLILGAIAVLGLWLVSQRSDPPNPLPPDDGQLAGANHADGNKADKDGSTGTGKGADPKAVGNTPDDPAKAAAEGKTASKTPGDESGGPLDKPDPKDPRDTGGASSVSESAPWKETLAAEPVSHLAFRYQRLDGRENLLSVDDVKKWLEPFGPGGAITPVGGARGTTAQIKGLFRLRSPWPEQAVLRMGLDQVRAKSIRLHVFHKSSGVLLVNTVASRERWSAYLVQRRSDTSMPDQRYLAVDDGGRTFKLRRQRDSPLELHWGDGLLRLVSGETTLLAAPLEGPPTDIFLEGTAVLYGMELRRCTSTPDLPPTISANPAPLGAVPWNTDNLPEGAKLTVAEDGAVTLEAKNTTSPGWAYAPLPEGLFHVEIQVDGADGSGVYLVGGEGVLGAPKEILRLVANKRDNHRLSLARTSDQTHAARDLGIWPQQPPPCIGAQQWVRLLAGPRCLQWWTGRDGERWASPELPIQRQPLSGQYLGLFHVGKAETKIRLSHIRLAPLLALNEFGARLQVQHPAPKPRDGSEAGPGAEPEGGMEGHLPPCETPREQAADAWRRIQTGKMWRDDVATLYGGSQDLSLDQRQTLLVELSRWLAVEGDTTMQDWLLQQMAKLAQQGWEKNRTPPYSWFHAALMRMDIPSSRFPDDNYEPARRLLDQELLGLVLLRRWHELAVLHEQITHYRPTDSNSLSPLVSWAGAVANRQLPAAVGSRSTLGQPEWIDQIDKSTFNTMVEFEGLLEAANWDAAAKLAATVTLDGGLAPHPKDDELLIGFSVRLRDACHNHPQLRDAMVEQAQPVAQLYVRRATAENEPSEVERIAQRFPSTPAAAEAWTWLGDFALADGGWHEATLCYREALREDPYAPGLKAKLQLALSLGGEGDPDWKPDHDADWGTKLTPDQTKQLLDSLREHNLPETTSLPLPTAAAVQLKTEGKLEAPFGRDPRQQVSRYVNERQVDWCGRQLTSQWVDDRLVVCNRFQLAAFQRDNGQRIWQTAEFKDPRLTAQRSRDQALTPSFIATDGKLVAARLLYGAGAVITCVDAASGEVQWKLPPPTNQRWASDPVIRDGRLWVTLVNPPTDVGDVELSLVALRLSDGQRLSEIPIGRMRQTWIQTPHCQLTPANRGILAIVDGTTLYVEPHGVRWLRRRPTPPIEADQRRPLEWIEPPRVVSGGKHAIIRHPGLPTIQCVNLTTGVTVWEHIVPGLASVLEAKGNRFLVWTDETLQCRDVATGDVVWKAPWKRRCRSMVANQDRILCLLENAPKLPLLGVTRPPQSFTFPKNESSWHLQWRRWSDGGVIQTTPLPDMPGKEPRVGPLVPTPQGYWLFHGDGVLDATRSLIRVTTTTE